MLNPDPIHFPDRWAVAWGEDCCGLWQAFEIQGVRQVMRWIPSGTFLMGSPEDEPERNDDEIQHQVTISRGYWLAETACTQALWQAVMGKNPSRFVADNTLPVEQVSWDDCIEFIEAANQQLKNPGHMGLSLRLPTEAEWEYACRAGTTTAFYWGNELTPKLANYDGNYPYADGKKGTYRERTVPVHSFLPNPWGLYQIHGNVLEWCADWYGQYPAEPVSDPSGPETGLYRVLRGGCWFSYGRGLRSARRDLLEPVSRRADDGLRLAGD
ncbi:MAG: formylglycine-generating enzyme family protein [Wenzhouxiangellaceae bacterium]